MSCSLSTGEQNEQIYEKEPLKKKKEEIEQKQCFSRKALDDKFSSTGSTTSPHKIQEPSIIHPMHLP